ncbi:lipoprotein signal peptidase [Neisseria weixii]|uniref:Lipoprotein signal peptidase n=1 Tax=Neisseria weixii TaxID=1853276 RepID=A0A3N4MKB1_9NEIS|nr:lipoprotein signal peptidase [Neisseria weixii]RPD84727.1 lipoprotein signal peptidase [Neisseria weixii]
MPIFGTSSLHAARKFAYLHDMSSLSVLLQRRTALKSRVLQKSRPIYFLIH